MQHSKLLTLICGILVFMVNTVNLRKKKKTLLYQLNTKTKHSLKKSRSTQVSGCTKPGVSNLQHRNLLHSFSGLCILFLAAPSSHVQLPALKALYTCVYLQSFCKRMFIEKGGTRPRSCLNMALYGYLARVDINAPQKYDNWIKQSVQSHAQHLQGSCRNARSSLFDSLASVKPSIPHLTSI